MDAIGLYYPYFHVRSDAWLKTAALYLPKIARVHPRGHPFNDSGTAEVLRDELDFFVDIDPAPYTDEVFAALAALARNEWPSMERLYAVPLGNKFSGGQDHYGWLHISQLGIGRTPGRGDFLWRLAVSAHLDATTDGRVEYFSAAREWVGMHPHLVSVYSCALAERIAGANSLIPVTDDPRYFGKPNWTVDDLRKALLGVSPGPGWWEGQPEAMLTAPGSPPAADAYVCAALQVVLPEDIGRLPARDIVRVRLKLADEFAAFRAHVDEVSEELARLDSIRDPGVVRARVETMVDRNLIRPMRDLERGLRLLGLQPARDVIALKSLELPAVAALGAHAINMSPVVGAGGAIAVQLVASARAARRTAVERRRSAAGYLLGLRTALEPARALKAVLQLPSYDPSSSARAFPRPRAALNLFRRRRN